MNEQIKSKNRIITNVKAFLQKWWKHFLIFVSAIFIIGAVGEQIQISKKISDIYPPCREKEKKGVITIIQDGNLYDVDVENVLPNMYQAYFENPTKENESALVSILHVYDCANLYRQRKIWFIIDAAIPILYIGSRFIASSIKKARKQRRVKLGEDDIKIMTQLSANKQIQMTEEEMKLLTLMVLGFSDIQIAERIGKSRIYTVIETGNLVKKFGFDNRDDLISYAEQSGFHPSD